MTDPTYPAQVAKIAAGLTKAQREALVADSYTPADDAAIDKPGIARQLHDLGLTFVDLSPFGYQVRQHLLSQHEVSHDG